MNKCLSEWVVRAVVLAASATASSAFAAPPPKPADDEIIDATRSASLASVVEDRDAIPADLALDATYVLPGFIDKDITLDNLRRRFGKANVDVADIDGAEGQTAKGIVLFARDPKRRAELFLRDESRLRGIAAIRVSGNTSRWHLANGVRPGLTLDQLVSINGKPITFNGLDWDYGGTVGNWNGGALQSLARTPVFIAVTLSHGDDAKDGSFPLGDGEFRSDDKAYPKQGKTLFVGSLMVSFDHGE